VVLILSRHRACAAKASGEILKSFYKDGAGAVISIGDP
jgi:hypothetical protein